MAFFVAGVCLPPVRAAKRHERMSFEPKTPDAKPSVNLVAGVCLPPVRVDSNQGPPGYMVPVRV